MKRLKYIFPILFATLFIACNDEKETVSTNNSFKEIIAGNYWSEEIRLIYTEGQLEIYESEDLIHDRPIGGQPQDQLVLLDKIYVEPESNKIRRYVNEDPHTMLYEGYYSNWYTIEYFDKSIRIHTNNELRRLRSRPSRK